MYCSDERSNKTNNVTNDLRQCLNGASIRMEINKTVQAIKKTEPVTDIILFVLSL